MSTTAMWLLLAVVVIVIVFASVLYKRTFTVHELALTGVMAALSLVAYLFFRVPFYGGSSFHLGNTFTALTALLLDGVSGGLAGAIGLALADILAGDPGYAVTTFVLKFIIGITVIPFLYVLSGFPARLPFQINSFPRIWSQRALRPRNAFCWPLSSLRSVICL